jgi:hypothetical protein
MEYYAGIDVSLEQSSVCIVDAKGNKIQDYSHAENAKNIGPVHGVPIWLSKWFRTHANKTGRKANTEPTRVGSADARNAMGTEYCPRLNHLCQGLEITSWPYQVYPPSPLHLAAVRASW